MHPELANRKFGVLYVDDEETALKYFRKGMEKDFPVFTAPNVAEAMALLERESANIGVVVTDQRMPGEPGVKLLGQLRQRWPSIIRVLMTAYSEIDSAIESVNSGSVFKYLTKPVDFVLLKKILTEAMELFLSERDRDALVREKASVLQRMIVADRVRSLAALAGGISHHLRNSMTAMNCFLEESPPAKEQNPYEQELLKLAMKEREELMQILQRVGQSTVAPSCQFAEAADIAEIAQQGLQAAGDVASRVTAQMAPDLKPIKVDKELVTRVFRVLVSYTARLCCKDGKLALTISAGQMKDVPGVRAMITGEGAQWTEQDVAAFFTPFAFPAKDPSDLGIDLLVAFFIAYCHGGDLIVHRGAPSGPGFELWLPADPAAVSRPELQDSLLEKLFSRFESDKSLPAAA